MFFNNRAILNGRSNLMWVICCCSIAVSLMFLTIKISSSSCSSYMDAYKLNQTGLSEMHKLKIAQLQAQIRGHPKRLKDPVHWSGDQTDYPIGWIKLPTIPSGEQTEDDGKLHIIFSTGCNLYQHWQSELLLATAALVGQRGRITRIVSGCHDSDNVEGVSRMRAHPGGKSETLAPMTDLLRSVNDDFGLFITPSFPGAGEFPWINKPSSIKYFFDNAKDELDRYGETVVAVLDPDFIFLRPLTQTGSSMEDVITTNGHDKDSGRNKKFIDVAKPGRPVAQRYYLGGGWVPPRFDLETILGRKDAKVEKWTQEQASMYTDVGPPMILTVSDWMQLTPKWEHNMLPILQSNKKADILSDMWAYSIASAELNLKHTILDHFMVSSRGDASEGYPWVDQWTTMSCRNPANNVAGQKIPVFLHMASTYTAKHPDGPEQWLFHKGHIPPNIFDCDIPLLMEAPDDLHDISKDREERRQAWSLCQATAALNRVLLAFKTKYCPNGFEQRKLIRLVRNKLYDMDCTPASKWCFPLAEIQGLPNDWRSFLFAT